MSLELLYLSWFKSYGCFSIFQILHFLTHFFFLKALVSGTISGWENGNPLRRALSVFFTNIFLRLKIHIFNLIKKNSNFFKNMLSICPTSLLKKLFSFKSKVYGILTNPV